MAEKNMFELLREKSILAILDGDVDFGEIETTDSKKIIVVMLQQIWLDQTPHPVELVEPFRLFSFSFVS